MISRQDLIQFFGAALALVALSGCTTTPVDESCEASINAPIVKPLIAGNKVYPDLMERYFPPVEQYLLNADLRYEDIPIMDYLDRLQSYVAGVNQYPVRFLTRDLGCAGMPGVKDFNVLDVFDAAVALSSFEENVAVIHKKFSAADQYHKNWSKLKREFAGDLYAKTESSEASIEQLFFYETAPKPYTYIALRLKLAKAGVVLEPSQISFTLKSGRGEVMPLKVMRVKASRDNASQNNTSQDNTSERLFELGFTGTPKQADDYTLEVYGDGVGRSRMFLPERLIANSELYVLRLPPPKKENF